MSRYIRILLSIAKFSIKDDLAYRWDFFSKILIELTWLFTYILFFEILFSYIGSFGGWGKFEVILLYGTYRVAQQAVYILSANLYGFHNLIERGELDFLLTKPIDAQFYSSVRKMRTVSILSIAAAILIVYFSAKKVGIQPAPIRILIYIVLVITSSIILYSFNIAAATLNFWFTRINNIALFFHEIESIGRIPITAFSRYARLFFTIVIPLVFLATVPAGVLLGKDMGYLPFFSFLAAGTTLFLTRKFWNIAIRSYTSAGG